MWILRQHLVPYAIQVQVNTFYRFYVLNMLLLSLLERTRRTPVHLLGKWTQNLSLPLLNSSPDFLALVWTWQGCMTSFAA